jgi:hypothetical protein
MTQAKRYGAGMYLESRRVFDVIWFDAAMTPA